VPVSRTIGTEFPLPDHQHHQLTTPKVAELQVRTTLGLQPKKSIDLSPGLVNKHKILQEQQQRQSR